MKIGIDLDGVTADFDHGIRRAYYQWFGEVLPRTDEWDEIVARSRFADLAELYDWLQDVPGFFGHLEPVPGALGALREIRRLGHEVVFITARPLWARFDTGFWLTSHGLPWPAKFAEQKSTVKCHVYIDDSPVVLAELKHAGCPFIIRLTRPWNVKAPGLAASDWTGVLGLVACAAEVLA